jgi:hypothetical protein
MRKKKVASVPDRLVVLGRLYKQRNALYGDNYKHFGHVMVGMFPQGVTLETEEEFNRFTLLINIVHKATRYARGLKAGGHIDSLDDIAVYAQMAQEFDDEQR